MPYLPLVIAEDILYTHTMNKNVRGFTIVELLIVIVVIAILAAISVVAYNGIQARARDTTRLQDIENIRKGLELYKAEKGYYPTALNSGMPSDSTHPGASWEGSYAGSATWLDRLLPYMSKVPKDPTNDDTHFYYYFYYVNNAICGSSTSSCYVLGVSSLDTMNALNISGVDKSSSDPWRSTVLTTRPVWRGNL